MLLHQRILIIIDKLDDIHKEKHANILDTNSGSVIKQSKKDLFDKLLLSHMNKLEKIGSNDSKFQMIFDKLKSFIFLKQGKKEFISQLNMLGYNKQNLIIKSWKKLISNELLSPDEVSTYFQKEAHQISEMSDEDIVNAYNTNSDDSDSDDSESDEKDLLGLNKKKISTNIKV